jgi:hypothetical protein
MPYLADQDEYDPITGKVRRRRGFDPFDPLAEEEELIPSASIPNLVPALPEVPDTESSRGEYSEGEKLREALQSKPEPSSPKWYNRLGAAGVGFLGGFLRANGKPGMPSEQTTQAAAGEVLYPGYSRKLANWEQNVQRLSQLAKSEAAIAEEQRKKAQHEASLNRTTAETEAARARGDYYRRPQRQEAPTPPRTYEAFLVEKLRTGTPEEQADAQKKLDDLNSKRDSAERNLLVREFHDQVSGEKIVRFYDPRTGNLVKEDKGTARVRPFAPPSPTTELTVGYRKKQEQARSLAGEAQRRFPNDREQARQWISEQSSDSEIVNLALKEIGNAPQRDDDDLDKVRGILGLPPKSSSAPASTSRNPYRPSK